MGLIGESGSGKTTMATALMRLSRPPAYIAGGEVLLEGVDLLSISDQDIRKNTVEGNRPDAAGSRELTQSSDPGRSATAQERAIPCMQ